MDTSSHLGTVTENNLQQALDMSMSVDNSPNRNMIADQSEEPNLWVPGSTLDWQSDLQPVASTGANVLQPRNLTAAFNQYPPVMLSDSTALQVFGDNSPSQTDPTEETSEVVPPNPRLVVTRSLLEAIGNLRRNLSAHPSWPTTDFSSSGILMRSNPFVLPNQTDQFLSQLSTDVELNQNWNLWQSRVMEWLRYTATELERMQQNDLQFDIQTHDLNEAIRRIVVCMGELKGWSDNNVSKLWGKLGETWNSLRDYCFHICQQQSQHTQVIQGMLQDMKSLTQAISTVSQSQVPEVVTLVNREFEKLNANCSSAFHEAQEQVDHLRKMITDMTGCLGTQATVVQGLTDRVDNVEGLVLDQGLAPRFSLAQTIQQVDRLEHLYRQLNGKFGGLHLNQLVARVTDLEQTVEHLKKETLRSSAPSTSTTGVPPTDVAHSLDIRWIHQEINNLQKITTEQEDRAVHQADILNGFANDIADLMQERDELKTELNELRGLILESRTRTTTDGYAAAYTGIHSGPKPRAPRPSPALGGTHMQTRGYFGLPGRDLEGGVADYGMGTEPIYGALHTDPRSTGPPGMPSTPPQPIRGVPQSQTHLQSNRSSHRSYSEVVAGHPEADPHEELQWRRFNRLRDLGHAGHAPSTVSPVQLRFGDRESTPHPETHSHTRPENFNSSVHQMVAEALKFDAWDGDWLEMEDWFLNWRLYCEAACSGMHAKAKTVLFLSKLPLQYSEFLKVKHLSEEWTDVDMMNWLSREKEMRVPLHQRRTAWEQLKPTGNSYQHLTNWFQKWHRRLRDLKVTESQVLDQFDLSVKYHFSAPLTEVLKTEQELKERTDPSAKIGLEQRYHMLLKEVSIADNVRALTDPRSGLTVSTGSRPRTSFSDSYRSTWTKRSNVVRTVQATDKKSSSPCYYCKENGHWISTCPKRKAPSGKAGNCYNCGKPGHLSKDCVKPRRREPSQSSGTSRNSWTSVGSRSSQRTTDRPARDKPQREISVKKSSGRKPEIKKSQGKTTTGSMRREKSPRPQGPKKPKLKTARVSEVTVEEEGLESQGTESSGQQ